jgi:twinkle protein
VEGELDKLALYEAGVRNAVSVPGGALPPRRVAPAAPPAAAQADRRLAAKFSFLRRAGPELAGARRIVLATDADVPGQALAEELARRLGRGRCALLRWPDGCKDANDALLVLGPAGLRAWVARAAQAMPAESLV